MMEKLVEIIEGTNQVHGYCPFLFNLNFEFEEYNKCVIDLTQHLVY